MAESDVAGTARTAARVVRVAVTASAVAMLERLEAIHGPLIFHQSGGCCDGSSPMCFPRGEFIIGQRDAYLGTIAGVPFYIGGAQFVHWKHTQLTIDVVSGRGSGFSVESPEGVRFLTRSRLFSEEELAALEAEGPVLRGEQADR